MGIQSQPNTPTPISNITQAMRDPRQPDLNPLPPREEPVDQIKACLDKLANDMKQMYAMNSSEYKIDIRVLTNVANSIFPGKALDLITAAKTQGLIYEQPIGVFRPS
jgi:hypothetical protein